MDKLNMWSEIIFSSLQKMGEKIMAFLPNLLGGIILLLIGFLVAKAASVFLDKLLNATRISKLFDKVNNSDFAQKNNISLRIGKLISSFVYYLIILMFLIGVAETLGWVVISQEIGNIVSYLPRLFTALIIFLIGFFAASVVKKYFNTIFSGAGINGANLIGTVLYYLILVIILITACGQAGIDVTVISYNFTLVLASLLFAFALAFGLGSKQVLYNLISTMYCRKNFSIGQKIKIAEITGTIISIENVSFIIQTQTGKVILPSHRLISETVEILE